MIETYPVFKHDESKFLEFFMIADNTVLFTLVLAFSSVQNKKA